MSRFRTSLFATAALAITLVLLGCVPLIKSSDASPAAVETLPRVEPMVPTVAPTPGLLNEYFLPPYYSNSYAKTIEASKNENGLVIYSSLGDDNWKPVVETFNERFPWIQVTTVNLGANEVFDRYNADVVSGERSADIIVTYSPDGWLTFANSGQINPYISEEDFFIPPWAKLAPGIYTIASDPMVVIYNKDLITTPPQSMEDIAKLANDPTGASDLRITSYDAAQNSTGLALNWFWINKLGEAGWDILKRIGKTNPDLKTSASSMVSSVQNGEAQIAYFVSPVAFLSQLDQKSDLGWAYLKDGQPILMRSTAITKSAVSPNSAKLMVNFLLSQEGQLALALGGMTPYRSDIANVDLFNPVDGVQQHIHFNQVMEAVGLDHLIFINIDPEITNMDKRNTFIEKWNQAMGK